MTRDINHQEFKMAAAGNGLIVFRPIPGEENALETILAPRSSVAGKGMGIIGGGFVECGELAEYPVGTIWTIAREAHRENREESISFSQAISRDELEARGQIISGFAVKTNDINQIHACNFVALRVTDNDQWQRIVDLQPGIERLGTLIPATLRWDDGITRTAPEQDISFDKNYHKKFFHKHELRAFGDLAWHAQNGKLW